MNNKKIIEEFEFNSKKYKLKTPIEININEGGSEVIEMFSIVFELLIQSDLLEEVKEK